MSDARGTATGTVFVVSAPSGGGKTSLVNALLERCEGLTLSVSHTTRAPRPGERNGEHYHFVTSRAYQDMVAAGDFLEHASVHGHGYGTSRETLVEVLQRGCDVVTEIDWQGARQIKALMPEAVGIFILPPSREALAERLQRRAQDSPAVIAARLAAAVAEMTHYQEFDYLVINDDFETALADLITVVKSAGLKSTRQAQRRRKLLSELLAKS